VGMTSIVKGIHVFIYEVRNNNTVVFPAGIHFQTLK